MQTFASKSLPESLLHLRDFLVTKIKDSIGLSMKVTLLPPGTIARSEGGKLSRIKDLRKG